MSRSKALIVMGSTPTPPLLAFTLAKAASRLRSVRTLSITLYQRPPFTPFCRACTIRGVQMVGSTQAYRPGVFPSRVAPAGTVDGDRSVAFATSVAPSCRLVTTSPPSWLPLLHAHYGASTLLRSL